MKGKRSVEKGRMHTQETSVTRSSGNLSRHTRRRSAEQISGSI